MKNTIWIHCVKWVKLFNQKQNTQKQTILGNNCWPLHVRSFISITQHHRCCHHLDHCLNCGDGWWILILRGWRRRFNCLSIQIVSYGRIRFSWSQADALRRVIVIISSAHTPKKSISNNMLKTLGGENQIDLRNKSAQQNNPIHSEYLMKLMAGADLQEWLLRMCHNTPQ